MQHSLTINRLKNALSLTLEPFTPRPELKPQSFPKVCMTIENNVCLSFDPEKTSSDSQPTSLFCSKVFEDILTTKLRNDV